MTDAAALLDELQRPWRHGEHFDGRGLVLDDPLVLDGMDIRGFDFSEAEFRAGFSAKGTRFRGLVWMRGAQIDGMCDLGRSSSRTDVRADGLRAGSVNLAGCQLQGVLSFVGARLSGLSLHGALVMANVTLEGAVIDGAVDLAEAELMGGLWTANAQIGALNRDSAQISGRVRLPS